MTGEIKPGNAVNYYKLARALESQEPSYAEIHRDVEGIVKRMGGTEPLSHARSMRNLYDFILTSYKTGLIVRACRGLRHTLGEQPLELSQEYLLAFRRYEERKANEVHEANPKLSQDEAWFRMQDELAREIKEGRYSRLF